MNFFRATWEHMMRPTGYIQKSWEYSILDKAAHTALIATAFAAVLHWYNVPEAAWWALGIAQVIYLVIPKILGVVRGIWKFHPGDCTSDFFAGCLVAIPTVCVLHGPLWALAALGTWMAALLSFYQFAD